MTQILSYKTVRCVFGGPDPGKPEPGIIQVFMEDGVPSMVDFLCPCGCGNTCPTHLTSPGEEKKQNDRRWQFSEGPNGVTLSPSIRWLNGCKAHFHITDGQTKFAGDSGK